MKNNKIDQLVHNSKYKFKNGITNYLTWQTSNCAAALNTDSKNNKDKFSKHSQYILRLLLMTRLSALNELQNKPENEYSNNAWAQCMNITNIIYRAANHNNNSKIDPKIAKAHFNYCCRYYLQTAPKNRKDHCLQIIYDVNKWNQYPLAEINAATRFMNKSNKKDH